MFHFRLSHHLTDVGDNKGKITGYILRNKCV